MRKTSDTDLFRTQDEPGLITSISSNPIAKNLVYNYLEENWHVLSQRHATVGSGFNNLIETVTYQLYNKYEKFRLEENIKRTSDLFILSKTIENK